MMGHATACGGVVHVVVCRGAGVSVQQCACGACGGVCTWCMWWCVHVVVCAGVRRGERAGVSVREIFIFV